MFCKKCGTATNGEELCAYCQKEQETVATDPAAVAAQYWEETGDTEVSVPEEDISGYDNPTGDDRKTPAYNPGDGSYWQGKEYGDVSGVPSYTPEKQDADEHKLIATLSYLGFLCFVPFFCARSSQYTMYHVRQGIVLFGIEAIIAILKFVFSNLYYSVSAVFGHFLTVVNLLQYPIIVLAIIGIYNVWKGYTKPLPLTGAISEKLSGKFGL